MTLQRSWQDLCACCRFTGNQCLVSWLNLIGCCLLTCLGCRCSEGLHRLVQRTRAVPESGQFASFDSVAERDAAALRAADEKKLSVLDAALNGGGVYADPDWAIPPEGAAQQISGKKVVWKNYGREKNACLYDPTDGPDPHAAQQGALGDCYLLASAGAIAERKKLAPLFLRPNPPNAPAKGFAIQLVDSAANTRIVTVDPMFPTLPDPNAGGASNSLAFARVKSPQGDNKTYLWLPVIEKAWAKLRGNNNYQAIEAGQPAMALLSLTGAAVQTVVHSELGSGSSLSPSEELWQLMIDRDANSDLPGGKANRAAMDLVVTGTKDDFGPDVILRALLSPCARCCDPVSIFTGLICPGWLRRCVGHCFRRHCWGCMATFSMLTRGLKGILGLLFGIVLWPCIHFGCAARCKQAGSRNLVTGHAYTVSGVHRVPLCGGKGNNCISRCCTVRLVKLRNPHGSKGEWSGTWSDQSILWKCVSPGVQAAIGKPQLAPGTHHESDGIFFMHVDDMAAHLATTAFARAREGWATYSVPTRVKGPCAYWIIQTKAVFASSSGAGEALPTATPPPKASNNPLRTASGKSKDAGDTVAVTVHSASPKAGGGNVIRCALTLLHVDGATPGGALEGGQAVRVTVFNNTTRRPVGSSRPQSPLSSYSAQAACGTDTFVLKPDTTYVVFAQWVARDSLMASDGGRRVVLMLSAPESAGAGLNIGVASAPPEPRFPFSPAFSPFGHCSWCSLPLPAEFCFVGGRRLHSECVESARSAAVAKNASNALAMRR
jgi:Calpain family cysteine protease